MKMLKMTNDRISAEYFAYSPFDTAVVDEGTKVTAITVVAVLCLFLITGLIGHCCVVGFISCSRSRTNSSCFSAYVIIGNLSAAHILFLVTCLPANAYNSIMDLVTSEWLFGDPACRLVSFLQMFLLGVTTLSFFALAIDRFRSADHVDKGYEIARDSTGSGICKMLVLWIGALLLALPELLLREVSNVAVPALQTKDNTSSSGKDVFLYNDSSELPIGILVLSKDEYGTYRSTALRQTFDETTQLKASDGTWPTSSDESNNGKLLDEELQMLKFNNTDNLYVRYQACINGIDSWKDILPNAIYVLIQNYYYFRHWWLLSFYFCLPVFFALLFALLVSRRLALAVENINSSSQSCAGSYYLTSGIDGGTLTSQREMDRAALVENSNCRTDSLLSHETHGSDAHYHQRGHSLDHNVGQSPYAQYQSRLSPLLSCEDLQDASPTIVVSNGSIRTIGSPRQPGEMSPQSPVSPSLACASGVSVLSLAMSNTAGNGCGTIGTASLPPHGHRRSIKRSSRAAKQTLGNAYRERALNSVLVTFVLGFTLTQLPLRIVSILQIETSLMSLLDDHYVALINALCVYFSMLTFVVNPIAFFLSFKPYRRFLGDCCC